MSIDPRDTRRLEIRFSLRALFVIIAILAVVVGYFGARWYRSYQQEQAVKAIEELGGAVLLDTEGKVIRVYLKGERFDDERLQQLLPHLRNLRYLRELDLVRTPVTDAGLEQLHALQTLELVYVFETAASSDGIAVLRKALRGAQVKLEEPDPVATRLAVKKIYRHALIAAAFHPSGDRWATGSGDGTLRYWRAGDSEPVDTIRAHRDWLFSVAWSADGSRVATGGGDNLVRIWDADTHALALELAGHEDDVHAVAFAGDGKLVSAGDDRTIRIWDLASGRSIARLEGHLAAIPSLAVNADRGLIASASRDGTVRLWDLRTGELLHTVEEHTDDVNGVAFSPDGALFASASYDGTIRVWETATRRSLHVLRPSSDRAYCVSFSADSKAVIAASADGVLRSWEVRTGRLLESRNDQPTIAVIAAARGGGNLLTGAAEGNLALRNPRTLDVRELFWTTFAERDLPVRALANRR